MHVRKYLVIQRCVPRTQEPASPEAMQGLFAAFKDWQQRFGPHIVDMGGRLAAHGRVLTAKGVTDGPFTETKEMIGGYMVIAAESYEQAAEIVRACPGVVGPESWTEIREIASP